MWTDGAGSVVIVGRGLCGRWEVGYEVDEGHRGAGLGRRLVVAARQIVPAGEPSELRAHIGMEIVDQRPAQRAAHCQAFFGALSIDGSLDLEQGVDAAHDLDCNRR